MRLPEALKAWGGEAFAATLKRELLAHADQLPLHEAMAHGSHVADTAPDLTIQTVEDTGDALRIRAGIFFASIIAGCSCADDPTPVDEIREYCEVDIRLDKGTGEASVRLTDDY
ncbi:MAG: hypothetical protein AB1831_09285 [Pseudomonadota bacterium]